MARHNCLPLPREAFHHAPVALIIRAVSVAKDGSALRAQLVAIDICIAVRSAAFQENHRKAGLAQFLGDDAAAGAGADDDRIDVS